MTFQEPPLQSDDTQPNPALSESVTIPDSKSQNRGRLSSKLLFALILFSAISLIATISLAFSRNNQADEVRIESVNVILRVAGQQTELSTNALTVADLLDRQGIRLSTNDALAPAPDRAITEGIIITVARAREITLIIDGETQLFETPYENPADILRQAEVTFSGRDVIQVDGSSATIADLEAWTVPATEITIDHAHEITVIDETEESIFLTTASTVGDALFEADIDIFLTDTVSPDVSSVIDGDLTVSISRARSITIHVDGTLIETRVRGATVADALSESGIALVALDYTIPAIDSEITADTIINILRVTESLESTDTTIPYETVYQADASLELDQQRIIQAGQSGIERFNERLRFENGVEVAREPIGTEIIQEAQNQILSYGTNIVIRTVDTPQGVREYWRVIRAYATSYHPEALGGDNITAIGMELQHGIIASNPNIIPYRTDLFVPGYGIGIMADTGGPRSSPYWVDLGYSDDDFVGWHHYVDVYLLTPLPAEIDYLLPNFRPMRGLPDN